MQFPVNAPSIWEREAETQQATRQQEVEQMLVTKQARQFRFRACTRCSGDAYVDFSDYEPEWRCLQCGRTVQPEAPASLFSEDDDRLAA